MKTYGELIENYNRKKRIVLGTFVAGFVAGQTTGIIGEAISNEAVKNTGAVMTIAGMSTLAVGVCLVRKPIDQEYAEAPFSRGYPGNV